MKAVALNLGWRIRRRKGRKTQDNLTPHPTPSEGFAPWIHGQQPRATSLARRQTGDITLKRVSSWGISRMLGAPDSNHKGT